MTELIQLSDAEIAEVAGGVDIDQSISISATQSNSSSISQYASATNYGNVYASASYGGTAIAIGAAASNTAIVSQTNAIVAANSFRVS